MKKDCIRRQREEDCIMSYKERSIALGRLREEHYYTGRLREEDCTGMRIELGRLTQNLCLRNRTFPFIYL